MCINELTRLPAAALAQAIRTKQFSSREVVQAHLQRIEEVNPSLNAVVQLRTEAALDEAHAADEALAHGEVKGPLHGVPITVKDSIEVAGLGRIALMQNDVVAAKRHVLEAISLTRELGERWSTAVNLDALGGVAARSQAPQLAAHLFGAAEAVRERLHVPVPTSFCGWLKEDLAVAKAQLDAAGFDAAFAGGKRMSLDEAVDSFERAGQDAQPGASMAPPVKLSRREVEVLGLVAQGLTDAQVAEKLVLSVRTVNFHLQSIYNKLGVNTRTAAVHDAITHKLV